MSAPLIAIFSMYFFILIGFSAKKIFKDAMDAKTLNLLSVYFLQPFLTFWGLLQRPIDVELLMTPIWYLLVIVMVLTLSLPFIRMLFHDAKERSIATVSALIGNTANLGIPLGIAIFGLQSIPYMTLINLMNVFVVYTIGVYFYSRGDSTPKESLLNIIKLPVLWFAILAIFVNVSGIELNPTLMDMLKMGAFASIVIQLMLFGIYFYEAKFKEINKQLITWVIGMKFIIIPVAGLGILLFIPIDQAIKAMIFMELFMPLAITNINLSSLYGCRPQSVTVLVFLSSILFLGLLLVYIPIMRHFF